MALLSFAKRMIPRSVANALRPPYHFGLAMLGTLWHRFPSRQIAVIGVTGTKGKSTVTEMLSYVCRESGMQVATANSIRFRIGSDDQPNRQKMTMPGRTFLPRFLRQAVNADCDVAVLELTSEGAAQYRHRGLALDALIFTGLEPEHIESHGSYEAYANAKLALARQLERSNKRPRVLIARRDSDYADRFLQTNVEQVQPFSPEDIDLAWQEDGTPIFTYLQTTYSIGLPGHASALNALATIHAAQFLHIDDETIRRALTDFDHVPGRLEDIDAGQPFRVMVDYAHTPGSLEALYRSTAANHRICVLGNAGGGRDTWKRPQMARIAEQHCDEVILTNEDPYDEDPRAILDQMAAGMAEQAPTIELDRRQAIHRALERAREAAAPSETAVLISGKGTDPYIMGPRGSKIPWDDATVVREELEQLGYTGENVHKAQKPEHK